MQIIPQKKTIVLNENITFGKLLELYYNAVITECWEIEVDSNSNEYIGAPGGKEAVEDGIKRISEKTSSESNRVLSGETTSSQINSVTNRVGKIPPCSAHGADNAEFGWKFVSDTTF